MVLLPNGLSLFPQPSRERAEDEYDRGKVYGVIHRIKPTLTEVTFGDSTYQSECIRDECDRYDSIPAIGLPCGCSETQGCQ